MPERNANERQRVALFWLAGFLASLFGILALPIVSGEQSALEGDSSEIGPFLIFAAVVLVLGVAGRTSPTLSGAAAGITALVSIVLSLAITIGIFLTVLLDDFDAPIEWAGGVYAAMIAAFAGLMAVITSARGWKSASPPAWTLVTASGAVASTLMIVGLIIPAEGLSLSDTLGFTVHPVVGLGFTFFVASLAAVGIAGFLMGRWGIGLLLGFFGFIFVGWLTSQSADQSTTFGWSGVDSGTTYHGLTVAGFWSATALLVVHVFQQYASGPTATTAAPADAAIGRATWASAWEVDPFGRFDLRFFDGSQWTDHVSSDGTQSTDPARHHPPADPAAAWHSDPFARHEHRYFDGKKWTDRVADKGTNGTDKPVANPPSTHREPTETSGEVGATEKDPGLDETTAPDPETSPSADDGWEADPFGRFELRYFDGSKWTRHVSTNGSQSADAARPDSPHGSSPAWHPDPFGRHDHRYFDGKKWTDQVADAGNTTNDEPVADLPSRNHEE